MPATPVFEAHLPQGRPFTWDDLQTIPGSSLGYQLIGGALLVTPSPGSAHQSCVAMMWRLLHDARPPGMVAKLAPFDIVPAPGESYQPDVLVARRADVGPLRMEVAPVLVVEVLSPSTRVLDPTGKRRVYADMGIDHYWIVDPDEPSVVAMRLDGGDYVEVARAAGATRMAVTEPFPVSIVPTDLLSE